MSQKQIRVHVRSRTPGHITLAVFCDGLCGELVIAVRDEALFHKAFPVVWVEEVPHTEDRFLNEDI